MIGQPTLDRWFDIKTPISTVKKYFYLSWVSGNTPCCNAVWLDKKPKDINFIESVKWSTVNKNHLFYLCGNFREIDMKFKISTEKKYKNKGFLKSHLQKCIRKGNDYSALPTAKHFIQNNLTDFLRRLPIIMIEDVILHSSFTTLIWVMVAISSTSFKIKDYIIEWLLGVVWVLCKIDYKDIEVFEIEEHPNIVLHSLLNSYNDLSIDDVSILYSMHLRIAYGGMKCDCRMIKKSIITWERRFRSIGLNKYNKNFVFKIRPIQWIMNELKLIDWDLSAIDFHCTPHIISFIINKYPDIKADIVKKLIWHNSSKINYRINTPIYEPVKWNNVKSCLHRAQKYILERNY